MFTIVTRICYKRQIVTISIFVIVLACIRFIFKLVHSKPYVIFLYDSMVSIACHYEVSGDALPSSSEESFQPPADSIFFHETSCQGGLNSRQACSVESAARAHQDRQIYVFFSGPVTEYMLRYSILAKLKEIPNVNLARVMIEEFAKGTPLESLIKNKTVDMSPFCVTHSADILRSLTLYKWSGIYLDTDVLVVKNFGPLGKNWVSREDSYQLNMAALALSHDELAMKLSEDIVSEIARSYDPNLWSWNGPGAMTRVVNKSCTSPFLSEWTYFKCRGFEVYDNRYIFPVHYTRFSLLYEPNSTLEEYYTTSAYAYHLWNFLSRDCIIFKDSPYDKLAREFCPTVYNTYGDDFGS